MDMEQKNVIYEIKLVKLLDNLTQITQKVTAYFCFKFKLISFSSGIVPRISIFGWRRKWNKFSIKAM